MSSKRKRATRKDKDDEDDKKRKADTKPKVAKRGNSSNTKFSRKKLKDWFSSYTEDSNEIGPNGVEKFCKDLGIEPEDAVVLVICWHLHAARMGYFAEEEFMRFEDLNIDSAESLKDKLADFEEELRVWGSLKEIYRYSFDFAKDPMQKAVDKETATELLVLLLGDRPHAKPFAEYALQQTNYRVINKDQWTQFLEFSESVKSDFSNYDENAAWPVIFDDYVAWASQKEGPSSQG